MKRLVFSLALAFIVALPVESQAGLFRSRSRAIRTARLGGGPWLLPRLRFAPQ